jgi:ATP-dependent Clp protease ATP-binding subunit ClpC
MFERFTAKARHVVVLSQEEARALGHNYIGTEHILLGLINESDGLAARVLVDQFKLTLDGIRQEVTAIVGTGKKAQQGHIPFTPRAKKVLELALREALQLSHNYIGTEHILLGVIREDDGVAAQVLRQHADLLKIRTAVLDMLPAASTLEAAQRRRWLRRRAVVLSERERAGGPGGLSDAGEQGVEAALTATPAADATLSTAARLAGAEPVGSHHLLLAALTDANSAAAKVLASLGIDLNQAKDALRDADVAGTSDEQPEDAGKRQMVLQVDDELITIVAADPVLVRSANDALRALGKEAAPGGAIRGADLQGVPSAGLAKVWQALHDTFTAITTREQAESGTEVESDAEPAAGDSGAA